METHQQWIFTEPRDENNRNLVVHSLNLLILRTRDLERSRRFYEAIGLRMQPVDYGHGALGVQGPVPPAAPLVLNVKTEEMPPPHTFLEIHEWRSDGPVPHQQLGFFVGSVDAALQAAINAGGKLLAEPANWPYGRRGVVADPDGNRIELSEDPFGRLTGEYPS
jgi:lactoylglutathione lyase